MGNKALAIFIGTCKNDKATQILFKAIALFIFNVKDVDVLDSGAEQ